MADRDAVGPALALRDVTCAYDGVPVLSNLSFSVERSAFVGIVGPSGAGKTTLLRALLGVLPVAQGSIEVFGHQVRTGRPPRVGYVPQLETVDWTFPVTVREVVAMGLTMDGRLFSWPWLPSP